MNDARATSDENGIYPDGVDKWQEIACGVYHTVGVTPTSKKGNDTCRHRTIQNLDTE